MSRQPASPQRGFTLVGVLILVAILGAVAGATVTAGVALQRRAAEEELLFIGLQYRSAFKSYYESAAAAQRFPNQLDDLLRDPRFPGVKRHLRKVYADPMTGKAEWGTIPAPGGGIMGVFSLSSGKPIKTALFPPEFAEFESKGSYAEWLFAYTPPNPQSTPASTGAAGSTTLPLASPAPPVQASPQPSRGAPQP